MDPLTLLLYCALIFATHLIGAIAAFGSSMLGVPLLAWMLGDVGIAAFTFLIVGTVQSIHIGIINVRGIDWRTMTRMLLFAAAGVPLGVVLAERLPQRALLVTLGIVVIASGLWRLLATGEGAAPETSNSRLLRPLWDSLMVLAGMIHGAFGCGGAPVIIVAQHTMPRKETFRPTLFVFWTCLNLAAIAAMLSRRNLIGLSWKYIVLGIPLVIAGNLLGDRSAKRLSQPVFARVVAGLLVLAGAALIVKSR